MDGDTRQRLNEWGDIALKFGTPLAVAALWFLRGTFATHENLAALEARMTKMDTVLAVMNEKYKVDERQDKSIEDHEQRLRSVERNK